LYEEEKPIAAFGKTAEARAKPNIVGTAICNARLSTVFRITHSDAAYFSQNSAMLPGTIALSDLNPGINFPAIVSKIATSRREMIWP